MVAGGLIWAGIPLFVSIWTAGKRGLALGPAILLALFGGFFGLLVVLIFYRPSIVDSEAAPGVEEDGSMAARLETLRDLLDRGLIGAEEYERKRSEVLERL